MPNSLSAQKWQELKRPFIWAKSELFRWLRSQKADSLAAIYRFYMDRGIDPPVKTSVEGKILERDGKHLTKTKIKGIALTVVPCNKHTHSEVVEVLKSQNVSQDMLDSLGKSIQPDVPEFRDYQMEPMARVHALAKIALEMIRAAKNK